MNFLLLYISSSPDLHMYHFHLHIQDVLIYLICVGLCYNIFLNNMYSTVLYISNTVLYISSTVLKTFPACMSSKASLTSTRGRFLVTNSSTNSFPFR